jgi:hypothetical protein
VCDTVLSHALTVITFPYNQLFDVYTRGNTVYHVGEFGKYLHAFSSVKTILDLRMREPRQHLGLSGI